jgi:flagellar biosynthetic protein FliR
MPHDFSMFFSTESIIIFILVFTRFAGMLATAPLISTFPIPMQIKAGLAVLSAFIVYPIVAQKINFAAPHDLFSLSILLFKEMAVGLLIGFTVSLIFTAVEIGGQILSIQMGLAIANALDPVTKQHTPVVGQFYLFIAGIVFINLNGTQWLYSTLYDSFTSIPVGMDFSFSPHLTQQLLLFTGQLFLIAFSIIIPIFSVLFIKTILMGIVSKILPQMNIFMVALPLQIYVGLALVLLLMQPTTIYIGNLFNTLLQNIHGLFM